MAQIELVVDDDSLNDAELWDLIDSAVAHSGSRQPHQLRHHASPPQPLLITHPSTIKPPVVNEIPPSPQGFNNNFELRRASKTQKRQHQYTVETPPADWKQRSRTQSNRYQSSNETNDRLQLVNQVGRLPSIPQGSSHEFMERSRGKTVWPEGKENMLLGGVGAPEEWMAGLPSSSVFKHFQNAAMAILEKGDYVLMQGRAFIKKSGWRKIAFFFNISFEIKDRTIEFDEQKNVQRAEFVVRASMKSGRYTDAWGSCDRGEKRYSKPNHEIPGTAETRAKTRACQDLLGIGEYKAGSSSW